MTDHRSPPQRLPAGGTVAHQDDGLLLLNYLWRLDQPVWGLSAVHIRLSRLQADLRRPHHLRVAFGMLTQNFKPPSAHLFVLADGDIFIVFPSQERAKAEEIIQQVHYTFQDDGPTARDDDGGGLTAWYEFARDFSAILGLAARGTPLHEESPSVYATALPASRDEENARRPLTSETLATMLPALDRIDLSPLFRRQFACNISNGIVSPPRLVEHYIGVSDLGETLLPGVALWSNPWLFQRFKVALDEKVLRSQGWRDRFRDGMINSINLTTETTEKGFFNKALAEPHPFAGKSILFEFDQADALTDVAAFMNACAKLRHHGHQICLDGLTEATFRVIDLGELGVDYVKMAWHPSWRDSPAPSVQRLQALIGDIGGERLVLTRVDCDEAVEFGTEAGVRLFQGRLIDRELGSRARSRRFGHRGSSSGSLA